MVKLRKISEQEDELLEEVSKYHCLYYYYKSDGFILQIVTSLRFGEFSR